MATAGTVTIKLDGDSATLVRELNKANEAANSTFTSIGQQAADLALKLAGIATAAGVAFAALAKHSFEANDALAKQADRLGVTTESLKTLQVAADLAGVSQELLVKSLQKQQKLMVDAADGSQQAADTFRNLGLSVETLINLPADQQFSVIAAALNNVENVTRRNALAMQIWGDRAADMINFAAEAGEGVGDLSETLGALNVTMSRFDASKIEQANDAVSIAKLAFEGLGNTIAVAVAPYVTALADDFTDAAKSAGGFQKEVADALEFVSGAIGHVGDAFLGLKIVFKEVAAAFMDVGGDIAALMGFLFDSDAARQFAANAKGAAAELEAEIVAAFNAPLPSAAIDKWFADAKAKADVTAKEIADRMSGQQQVGSGAGGGGDQAKHDAEELKRWLDQMKSDAAMNQAIAPKVIIPEIKPGDFLPDPEVTRQFTEMSTQQYLAQWQLANEQRAAAEQVLRDTLYQSSEQAGQALIQLAAEQARQKVQAEFQARGEAMGDNGQFLDPRAQAEFEQQVRTQTLSNEQIFLQQRLQMQQQFGTKYVAMEALIAKLVGKTWADGHKKSLTVAASFATAAMSIAQTLFGDHKGFAIAMAIINTLTGVTQALASVPYPANIAAAASVAATGFAQVQQIRSTTVGSGVSTGGFSSGAVSTPTSLGGFQGDGTSKDENKQVTVQFNGPLYGMDKYVQEQLVGAIRDAVDGKDIVLFGGQSRQAQIIRGSG